MKNILERVFLLSLIILWMSCSSSKEEVVTDDSVNMFLEISSQSLSFSSRGESQLVTVRSAQPWDVVVDGDGDKHWLKVSPMIGKGNATLTVTATVNSTGKQRRGIVKISSLGIDGFNSKEIIVIQAGTDAGIISDYSLPFKVERLVVPADEELNMYTVTSPVGWVRWKQMESDGKQVVFQIEDNNTDLPREATLIISSLNGEILRTVNIFQYGKPNPRIGDDISVEPLAFPGAEGGGRFTTGGRGGVVYHVTNLLDYAQGEKPIEGSLRYGLDLGDAKTIVFDVAGYIDLKRPMQIVKPNFSIVGQTAPGDGITLRNYELAVRYGIDNVLIRFIRVRTGEQSGGENDAISGRWFKNGIIDHVSGSWSVDECISFYGVKDFTLQWCIAAESLNNSVHEKGAHGYGAMFSGDNATCHHFLIMHHSSRTPRVSALSEGLNPDNELDNQGYSDFRNLVVYNWNGRGNGAYGGEFNPFNWVNNYMKAGQATGTGYKSWQLMKGSETSRIYADGNYATANVNTFADNWKYGIWDQVNFGEEQELKMKVDTPHPFSEVTTHSAQLAYERVADYAGASLRRDAVDKRLVTELRNGIITYSGSVSRLPGIIDKTSDVGGYPDLDTGTPIVDMDRDGIPDIWEEAYGLDKNDPNDAALFTLDPMGRYSNLEVYFHNLVQHIIYYQNLGGTILFAD